ncbi:uncharacterized protein LOC117138648 [Drosophila mauritiana]|uniref:Uncharacterized protein LOC117138648 n=1 Tax=Drosophila mauritiana TaxID=7226 RepID=A0A6P8JLN7_DROMA|nr:uncharacterized protein LOC117138648 [Drosophila mauritiana]
MLCIRGHFEFNNVVCLVRDRMFMDFEYCYLKSVNRTYKYLSLKTRMRMRENRRLLYNFDFKVDSCKFLRDRKHVVANWVYQTFAPYSNLNHTCPYDHDVVLDKLPVQHLNKLVQSIIPDGRCMMNSTWMVAGIPLTDVILYFTKS